MSGGSRQELKARTSPAPPLPLNKIKSEGKWDGGVAGGRQLEGGEQVDGADLLSRARGRSHKEAES